MSKEKLIQLASWIITTVLLLLLVPKDKIRDANVIFLFKQFLTWGTGLLVVEKNLIIYPVRLFKKATRTSFTFEYYVYPAICVFFNLYYPFGGSLERQALHYVLFTSGITIFELILERHTQLITYTKWAWYWTWITIFATFMASNFYYRWFFHIGT